MSDEFLSQQLIKLGDMMGDGLNHEPDGKWIEREYRAICKKLHPEIFREAQQKKNKARDQAIAERLKTLKCPECSGEFKQVRSGSYVIKCLDCQKKYTFNSKGKKRK